MGKSVLFNNAKNTVFKKWSKDFAEKGGKELGGKVMDGIIDQSIKKEAPKNLSKLTRISKEASEKVSPKSKLLNSDWAESKINIKDASSNSKQFNQRVKRVREKEIGKLSNANAPKKLYTEGAYEAKAARETAEKKVYDKEGLKRQLERQQAEARGSKIYGDREARKDFKFSQDGPKKLTPVSHTPTREENLLRSAVPMAVGGAMIFTMANKRGQQSNSQLYGQQTPYQ